MSLEDGVFAKHLMTPEVLMSLIWPLTVIILAFIFCIFYLVLELIRKPDTEKSNIHVYIRPMINSRISSRRQKVSKVKQSGACHFDFSGIGDSSNSNNKQAFKNEQQNPRRKPKMSKPLSGKKEKEELFQKSHAIQLLSQIYDMTKSLLNDTREVIKKFDQNEETSKNSTECIKAELEARQKEKESQPLIPDNLSPGEAPGSLEGIPACINHRNSHASHSTNTLDSKAGKQIKDYGDVPKEIAPFLKNNSLRRITYHFNEIQSPTASNTNNNGLNISTITSIFTSFALIISLLLLKFGNIVTTVKNTYYIEKNVISIGSIGDKNSNLALIKSKDNKVDQSQNSSTPVATAAGGIAGTHDPKYQTLAGMGQECFGADKAAGGSGGGGAPTGGPVCTCMAGTHDPNYQTLAAVGGDCFGADKKGGGGGGAAPKAPAAGGTAGTHDPNY